MRVEPKSDYSNAGKGALVMLDKIECMQGAGRLDKSTLTDRQGSEG